MSREEAREYGAIFRDRDRTVVFVQPEMWDTIDGETLMILLAEIAETLPEVMRLVHEGQEVVVVDYEI